MKTFIISIILFIAMVTIIIINSAYINQTADKLTQMAVALPSPDNIDYNIKITIMEYFWEENYRLVGITVSLNDMNKVTDCISQLKAYSTNNNDQDFESTRQLLINAINNLHRLEKLSLGSIM